MNTSRFLPVAFIALSGLVLASCSNLQSLDEKPADRKVEASMGAGDLDHYNSLRLRYAGSLQCQMFSFWFKTTGEMLYFYNPNDPNCAKYLG